MPRVKSGVRYQRRNGKPPEQIVHTDEMGRKLTYTPKADDQPLDVLERGAAVIAKAKARQKTERIEVTTRSPYGPTSEHSWLLDEAAAVPNGFRNERLKRLEASHPEREMRAITSSTLGGLIPATIPPYVAEAIAYGVRSTAPLAAALMRLDLPPVGNSVAWAKITTGATVTNQSAENAALTASADPVVASTTDPLRTIGAYADFSAQTQELSGGWFDIVIGEELGRAFGARLEAQIWAGSGSGGQITGFAVMTGNSSSTVSAQTLTAITSKINEQYQAVAANLGELPDVLAMSPRRYANLMAGCNELGLAFDDALADSLDVVVSPAAPVTLGGGTEDWMVLLNRAGVPLVRDAQPRTRFWRQGPSIGTNLTFRWEIDAYVALGVSRRPEAVGIVKGATTPTFA